jgi:hypothetical protein
VLRHSRSATPLNAPTVLTMMPSTVLQHTIGYRDGLGEELHLSQPALAYQTVNAGTRSGPMGNQISAPSRTSTRGNSLTSPVSLSPAMPSPLPRLAAASSWETPTDGRINGMGTAGLPSASNPCAAGVSPAFSAGSDGYGDTDEAHTMRSTPSESPVFDTSCDTPHGLASCQLDRSDTRPSDDPFGHAALLFPSLSVFHVPAGGAVAGVDGHSYSWADETNHALFAGSHLQTEITKALSAPSVAVRPSRPAVPTSRHPHRQVGHQALPSRVSAEPGPNLAQRLAAMTDDTRPSGAHPPQPPVLERRGTQRTY